MSVFRVWAPTAERVEVQLGAEAMGGTPPQPMHPAATPGWWEAEVAEAAASGTDYAFRVDGGRASDLCAAPAISMSAQKPGRTDTPGSAPRLVLAGLSCWRPTAA